VPRGKNDLGRENQRAKALDDNPEYMDPKLAMLAAQQAMVRQAKRDTQMLEFVARREFREKKLTRLSAEIRDEHDPAERAILVEERKKLRSEPSPQPPVFTPSPEFQKSKYVQFHTPTVPTRANCTPTPIPTFQSTTNTESEGQGASGAEENEEE